MRSVLSGLQKHVQIR